MLLQKIKAWLIRHINAPISYQGRWLQQVVRGYFLYHAVPGNFIPLNAFRREVNRLWHRLLRRRSQKHALPWSRMKRLIARFIPSVRVLHPHPGQRFAF